MATEPLRQAVCRQVVPFVSQASALAPNLISQRTPSRFRELEKSSRSRSTSLSSWSVSLKMAPALSQAAVSKSSVSTPCLCEVWRWKGEEVDYSVDLEDVSQWSLNP